ncbi:MAG: formylglycine-generating enzyme family protein [Deltaproteobacteria bacterium]|nr:formylglycine-generating enzyme family protein [Deltaproteobacteria bacterium]
MSAKRPLTVQEFTRASAELGFDIKDILSRDVATRAATLKALYESDSSLLAEHRKLKSERLTEGLAYGYGIEDQKSVADILAFPGLGPRDTITVLQRLYGAYLGDVLSVAAVVRTVPTSHQGEIATNIARGLEGTSLTNQALGNRLIPGLRYSDDNAAVFSTIVGRLKDGPPIVFALKNITARMGGHRNYAEAEREWFRDPSVDPGQKAEMLRVRRQMGIKEESLLAEIPESQKQSVRAAQKTYSNRTLFEGLARGREKILANAKPESFEFQAFYLGQAGRKFRVGSPEEETGRYDNEAERELILTRPFEMQMTPVTQRQWELVMGNERRPNFSGNPDNPMEMVSWEDAVVYAKRLSELDPKYNYRLPTEAEWEVAVRAGTRTRFSFGDKESELKDSAWYSSNSGSRTHPVAELKPNANGLFDMHGNVWEWVQDWYSSAPPEGIDPPGPTSGSSRVIRGGSWDDVARSLRSAERCDDDPGARNGDVGFRLVRTPK